MLDAAGEALYVGKAGSLRARVGSYFVPSADLGPRKQPLLQQVHDVRVMECEGEWEALLLEARLIKDLRPPFNALGLDDRTYPYLVVTVRDACPGVFVTRQPAEERFKGGRIFGPFTSVGDLRSAVQLLQRVFRYRTCELAIEPGDPANSRFRPCLLHAIHQCSAPCANRIEPDRYREDIDRFLRFLDGSRSAMLRELTEAMEGASRARDYERAASLRDQVRAIERLADRERTARAAQDWQPEVTVSAADPGSRLRSLQRLLGSESPPRCIECVDIAHLGGAEAVGATVCFVDGRPFRSGYRRFRVRTVRNDDFAAIREVVSRRYRQAGAGEALFPDLVLIDGGPAQLAAALEVFATMERRPEFVLALSKREELLWRPGEEEAIRLSRDHLGLRLCQSVRDEAHRFAQHYHHILRSKSLLEPGGRRSRKR